MLFSFLILNFQGSITIFGFHHCDKDCLGMILFDLFFSWYSLSIQNVGTCVFQFWEVHSSEVFDCFFLIGIFFWLSETLMILMLFLLNLFLNSPVACSCILWHLFNFCSPEVLCPSTLSSLSLSSAGFIMLVRPSKNYFILPIKFLSSDISICIFLILLSHSRVSFSTLSILSISTLNSSSEVDMSGLQFSPTRHVIVLHCFIIAPSVASHTHKKKCFVCFVTVNLPYCKGDVGELVCKTASCFGGHSSGYDLWLVWISFKFVYFR